MKPWLGILLAALVAACASSRVLVRPSAPIRPGEVWLSGRLTVAGLEGQVWDDPFKGPYARALLIAAWRGADGTILLAPARPDGTFLCSVPNGPQHLIHLLVATPAGDLLKAMVEPPLAVAADQGAYDLGGLHWHPKASARAAWLARVAAPPHAVRQLTLSGRVAFFADPLPGRHSREALADSQGPVQDAPFARRARLYGEFDALARRWAL